MVFNTANLSVSFLLIGTLFAFVNSQYHYVWLVKQFGDDLSVQEGSELHRSTRKVGPDLEEPPNLQCGVNESIKRCPTRCEDTCAGPAPGGCMRSDCIQNYVCACKFGYVRDQGICVEPKTCPGKCLAKPNEEFRYGYCDGDCNQPYRICNVPPKLDCFCKKDHVRYFDGNCVYVGVCPPRCTNINEELRNERCDNTCEERDASFYCTEPYRIDCFCKKSRYRNEYGKCVNFSQCFIKRL